MKQRLTGILYGWGCILILMFIASIIMAFFLKFSSLNESTLKWISLFIGLLTLFSGGLVAGIKSKDKGWLTGMVTGLGFSFLVFLVQYLGYKHGFSLSQSLHHLGFVFSALLGGVLGVNTFVKAE